jgi:hypothetical protein
VVARIHQIAPVESAEAGHAFRIRLERALDLSYPAFAILHFARQTLALYFEPDRGVVPKQAEIDLKGLAQVIAFMGEGGAITPPLPQPEWFVDLQYLRAAGAQ